ncbi:hypothetical protein BDP27DRAFT_1424021 [Rhodocollybia butyracea]|uniref:F-box domain-containing protein n=1 Tax=Rhodocollybia butyracea TaxID=206335 RepID=A0A9P5U520_9AGAR|nr:hypothetical protein BDP27DRAFT_1424021 [Rhodocollybia butyracea]
MHLLRLPNELLICIVHLLAEDKKSLATLACLSQRTRHLAYMLLYQTVTVSGLPTLSGIGAVDNELHPAAYVQNLVLNNFDFPCIFRDSFITKHLYPSIQNVGCDNHSLSKFSFQSFTLSLFNAIPSSHVPHPLLDLKILELRTPFPADKIRHCTSIFSQLCSCSLTYLALDFLGVTSPPDYTTISKLLRPLPQCSSNLQSLILNLGTTPKHRPWEILQLLFNDDNFAFIYLNEFSFESVDEIFRLRKFLLRHPQITKLGYRIVHSEDLLNSEKTILRDLRTPAIVPNITVFTGSLVNALFLCNSEDHHRPLICLVVHCRNISQHADCLDRQLNELRKATGIDELRLTSAYTGYSLIDITNIAAFCPKISRFGCLLGPSTPSEEFLNQVYFQMLKNLFDVKLLSITVDHYDEAYLVQRHIDAIARAVQDREEVVVAI